MRITQSDIQLLRLPLTRHVAAPTVDDRNVRIDHVLMLVVQLDTDAGHRGLGFAYSLHGGGKALKALATDDIALLITGEDPLDHERLGGKVYRRLQGIGRRGLVMQAYSAFDLALWDIKGKAAGMPLYKLLGGVRESTPVYSTDAGWLWMTAEEVIAAAGPYLDQGMMGIKVQVGGHDPEADAERLTRIREALGEDIWMGVDANQRYDYATAMSMGRFFEEEIGVDWFEEPISCEDVAGHARLGRRLEVPLALGETLFGLDEFAAYLDRDAVDIVQPDITRVGGLTPWLKIAALVEQHHRPMAPHLLPEIGVHLACGLSHVMAVEHLPWLFPAFVEPPAVVKGRLVPNKRPGLGLELNADAMTKFRVV